MPVEIQTKSVKMKDFVKITIRLYINVYLNENG